MDFTETFTLAIPDLGESLQSFVEHRGQTSKGLICELSAIHEGMTANFNHYPATELAAALPSWTSPYPKPVLLHHDPFSEPVGRVVGARMDKEDDGTPYVRLQVAITASEAVQKVKDQRYLTGSVGGKAGKALCSICQSDWSNASMFDLPCKHRRGKPYNGKMAHIEMADITFKEYSFVNMPADQRSGVRTVHAPMEGEEFQPARFFCLDMATEGIVELGESERNVLEGLQPQHATSLYLGLKSAFLSAMYEDSRQTKESGMGEKLEDGTDVPPEVEEDDVLAVAESLSDDLSTTPDESAEEEGEEGEEEGEEAAEDEAEEGGDEGGEEEEEGTEPPAPSDESTDDAGDESAEPDGHVATLTIGDTEGVAVGSSATATGNGTIAIGSTTSTPSFTVTAGNTTYSTVGAMSTGNGSYTVQVLPDPKVAELEGQVALLQAEFLAMKTVADSVKEENTRLRSALKKGLAERVVDTKIAMGMCEFEQREAELEEHLKRSASSLADTIRDLASMVPQQRDLHQVPVINPTIGAITGDEGREPIAGATTTKPADPEDIFVDALMGRRSL